MEARSACVRPRNRKHDLAPMRTLAANTDPTYDEPSRPGRFDRSLLHLLRDPRDLPFPNLTLRVAALLLPLAVVLYLPIPAWLWWPAAMGYLYLNNVTYKGPFGLMLHCSTHRALYKKEYNALNLIIPWVLAPFFGQSPGTYRAHHVGMHHVENNLEPDESSTMPYQRDSARGFTRYFLLFFFTGIYTLCAYLFMRRRKRLLYGAVRGEALFLLMCGALCLVNWQATLVVFILPFITFRLVAMAGNWVQHAFVCAEEPGNHYTNSITCINVAFNHKCWNDGYHISHHIDPTMHWTEHPAFFRAHLALFAQNKAVVFEGLNYLDIFGMLMRKRYDLLAHHFVDIGGHYRNDAEVIAFLRSRTAPIPWGPPVPA